MFRISDPCSRRWTDLPGAVMAGVLLTTISSLLAQDGRVRVVVMDATGAGVNGAEVRIGERRLTADALGVASFVGLPVGRVEVASAGFKIWRGTLNVLNGAELQVGEVPHAGRLRVAVSDPMRGVVVNAEVAIECAGGTSGKARTDSKGVASFMALPVGNCRVEATSPGFKVWHGAYPVTADGEARMEAQLEVAGPGTKVAVRPKPVGRRFLDWLRSCARR